MATVYKRLNNAVHDKGGQAWNQKYGIADTYSANFLNVEVLGADGNEKVRGDWNSATAFSSAAKAACINFPKGSEIFDIQAKIIWKKIAASGTDTWCYSATMT